MSRSHPFTRAEDLQLWRWHNEGVGWRDINKHLGGERNGDIIRQRYNLLAKAKAALNEGGKGLVDEGGKTPFAAAQPRPTRTAALPPLLRHVLPSVVPSVDGSDVYKFEVRRHPTCHTSVAGRTHPRE